MPLPPQPSHRNAQLGFPHPEAIKKFRMWLGRAREVDLEGSECCWGCAGWSGSAGLAALVLPRFAQHLGQVTYNGDDASCPPREQGYQGERQPFRVGWGWGSV